MVAAALLVPRFVESTGVEKRVREGVLRQTGREFVWSDLEVGVLPPRLSLQEPRLSGETPDASPFLEARSLSLRLSVPPLLAGAVVVDSLEIEGATLRLVRTEDGIQWPRPPDEPPEEPQEPQVHEPPRERAKRRSPDWAVRSLALRDVRVVLDDRAVSPPVSWDLAGLSADVLVEGLEGPIQIGLDTRIGDEGRLEGHGLAGFDRTVDLCLELSDVSLSPLRPYLRGGGRLDGALSGKIHVRGSPGAKGRLAMALNVRGARVDVKDLKAQGALRVDAVLLGPPFSGPFQIDATSAEMTTGGSVAFRKPPGMPAVATGQFQQVGGRYGVEGMRVEIGSGGGAKPASDPCLDTSEP